MPSIKASPSFKAPPRVLLVSLQISNLPERQAVPRVIWGDGSAALCATLFGGLLEVGVDAQVVLPDGTPSGRSFSPDITPPVGCGRKAFSIGKHSLAQDRTFYDFNRAASGRPEDRLGIALTFQREVINTILPAVRPDLVHCFGWMTGLVPAAAQHLGIKSIFTAIDLHNAACHLADIEDAGIRAAFWRNLYFQRMPVSYEETRTSNPVGLLASGIFSSDVFTVPGEAYLMNIIQARSNQLPSHVREHILTRWAAGTAMVMPPVPPPFRGNLSDDAELDSDFLVNEYLDLYESVLDQSLISTDIDAVLSSVASSRQSEVPRGNARKALGAAA